MMIKRIHMAMAIVTIIAAFSVHTRAQQPGVAQAKQPAVAAATSNATATSDKASDKANESSERERALLDRIDKLERRLAEIETRTANNSTGNLAQPMAAPSTVATPASATDAALKANPSGVSQNATKPGATTAQGPEKKVPFGFGDFTWMNGNNRQKTQPLTNEFGTVTLYFDAYYNHSFNRPRDNTIVGSATTGRDGEIQINLASVGFETLYKNVIGKITFQTGDQLNIVQEVDGSTTRGRNLSNDNLKHIREATAGYHFDKWYGVNVEAGIFPSYIGLESYLLAENWSYNRSLVCDFTPFYFQGMRVQIYPTAKLKQEIWVMNGFQTYGKWNRNLAVGSSTYYRPKEGLGFVANFYYGTDQKNNPDRKRFHHDDSILVRYLNKPESTGVSKMAFSLNSHYGFETGGIGPSRSRAYMTGTSLANRIWFDKDKLAFTIRGEAITNPSRYLAPVPTPSGFLPGADNDSLKLYGITSTFDIMPTDNVAFRMEFMHRGSNVPFFAGRRGTTSPDGFQGTPGDFVPDVRKRENRLTFAINFRL